MKEKQSGFLFNEEITIIENFENYFCHFRNTHKNVLLISNLEDLPNTRVRYHLCIRKGSTNMYFLHLVETYHKSIHFVITVHHIKGGIKTRTKLYQTQPIRIVLLQLQFSSSSSLSLS
jgi:hypothetical protein